MKIKYVQWNVDGTGMNGVEEGVLEVDSFELVECLNKLIGLDWDEEEINNWYGCVKGESSLIVENSDGDWRCVFIKM